MSNLYIFEAGSTKTDLIYEDNGERKEHLLPGFNPNRGGEEFKAALKGFKEFSANSTICFYGSGLASSKNKTFVKELFKFLNPTIVNVHDDILGAARAAFNSSPGIICIMGTGGLAAYYNGRNIVCRRGGYGYLIDDLGGGFELGKRIIAAWMNDDLSEECNQELSQFIDLDKGDFIDRIYQTKDLKLIASVAQVVAHLADESLQNVVNSYFEDFFKRNVVPLSEQFGIKNFSVVGSIGMGYYKTIRKQSDNQGLQLDQCIQRPALRLFEYHAKSVNPF